MPQAACFWHPWLAFAKSSSKYDPLAAQLSAHSAPLAWQLKLNIKMALNCPFSEFSKSTSLAKRGVACRAASAWGAHSACAGEAGPLKVRCCRSFCLVARAQTAKSRHLSGRLRAQRTRRERPQATKLLLGGILQTTWHTPINRF